MADDGGVWAKVYPDAMAAIGGGKILQVVRATDSTERTTTKQSFEDAGISVTITPQRSDSAILLIASCRMGNLNVSAANFSDFGSLQITDNSNTAISGAEAMIVGVSEFNVQAASNAIYDAVTIIGYATPATTSATTYKMRYMRAAGSGLTILANATNTGQLYAIEVAA